jgi:hypothetical protein
MELHKFSKLRNLLISKGISIDEIRAQEVIREDFEKILKDDKIEFLPEGIFYVDGDSVNPIYAYIEEYNVTRYNSFPRIHTHRCRTLDSFIASGNFNKRYIASDKKLNRVINIGEDPVKVYEEKNLNVCKNCISVSGTSEIVDSTSFAEYYRESIASAIDVEVDKDGYTLDWNTISRNYRNSRNYICEKCFRKPSNNGQRVFWHTHHIDLNKRNNAENNLMCLCIQCHSEVDETHKRNFSTNKWQVHIKAFKKLNLNKVSE